MHRRLFLKFVPSIPFASFTNTLYFLSCICNDPLSTKKILQNMPAYAIGKIDDSQISFITFKKLSLNPSCLRGLLTISDWDKIRKGLTNSLHYDVRSFFLSLINHLFFLACHICLRYLPQRNQFHRVIWSRSNHDSRLCHYFRFDFSLEIYFPHFNWKLRVRKFKIVLWKIRMTRHRFRGFWVSKIETCVVIWFILWRLLMDFQDFK